MKDSGIEWIGEIPETWEVKRVKHGFVRKKEEAHQEEPIVLSLARSGVKVRDITNNEGQLAESYYNYNPVEPGDFLLNPMDLYSGANCSISKVSGVISPAYINLRARKGYNPAYYDYYFKTQYWAMAMFAHGKGVSFDNRWTLNANDLLNYYIPVPAQEDQDAIAEYIDQQCAHIDAVIEKTKASIEEYKKLKQAVITEAVTKGVRGDRPMKDSGIDGIGEIPTEWTTVKITRILDYSHPYPFGDGDHGLIKTEDYIDKGIPYIRVQNLGWGTELILDNLVYISDENNQRIINSTLRPDDILFAKTGATIGKTAIVPSSLPISNTTSHVGKITVNKKYYARYIFYLLSSFVGYKQFWDIACLKTTRPELAIEEMKAIRIIVPGYKEQHEIVNVLDKKCIEIEKLMKKKEQYLEELETLKKSLIYEYVTGKKEVPQSCQ